MINLEHMEEMIVAYIKIVFQGNFSRDVGAP
jgi:hypothetical protein